MVADIRLLGGGAVTIADFLALVLALFLTWLVYFSVGMAFLVSVRFVHRLIQRKMLSREKRKRFAADMDYEDPFEPADEVPFVPVRYRDEEHRKEVLRKYLNHG